jgi:predicted tellurium resistance membrane protein TerC
MIDLVFSFDSILTAVGMTNEHYRITFCDFCFNNDALAVLQGEFVNILLFRFWSFNLIGMMLLPKVPIYQIVLILGSHNAGSKGYLYFAIHSPPFVEVIIMKMFQP